MKRSVFILMITVALLLAVLEVVSPEYTGDPTKDMMIGTAISRTAGGVIFLVLIVQNKVRVLGIVRDARSLFVIVPALAVAINNAPIIALASGAAKVYGDSADIALFALQSLAVGFFEEMAFRGYLFPLVLERFKNRKVFFSAVVSSAVFAAVHLVNLFSGASPAAVLLQIGYSFLIGGMCAVVLLKTRCIWVCVALHAIYNFGGTLIPTLGGGRVWDTATVAITAILGVAVLVYMLYTLVKIDKNNVPRFIE